MQLNSAFARLPLRFDAERLAEEVRSVPEDRWNLHPQGYAGNTALPLLAVDGDPDDDGVRGIMEPTPILAELEYLRQVLASLEAPIGRTRLMRIDGHERATPHIDTNYYWHDRLAGARTDRDHDRRPVHLRRRRRAHGGGRVLGVRHLASSRRGQSGGLPAYPSGGRHRGFRIPVGDDRRGDIGPAPGGPDRPASAGHRAPPADRDDQPARRHVARRGGSPGPVPPGRRPLGHRARRRLP